MDEFSDPFHPDPLVVNVYKSKLNHHIENGVGSNLKTRLSSDLQLNMETQQKDMMERMTFEVLYHLNCDNLCSDFQEDLGFKFSLGLSCLINRFMAAGNAHSLPHPAQAEHDQADSSAPLSPLLASLHSGNTGFSLVNTSHVT